MTDDSHRGWSLARGHTATLTPTGFADCWIQGGQARTSHIPTGAVGQVVLTRRRGPLFALGWAFVLVAVAGVVYDGAMTGGRFAVSASFVAAVALIALSGVILILANLARLHVVIRGHAGQQLWASPRTTPAATLDDLFGALTEGGNGL